jgi:glycosyltransferase involved in cell wall biosynthesis
MEVHYLINSDADRQWHDGPISISAIPRRRLLRKVLGRCYVLDYFRVQEVLRRIGPDVIYVRGASAYLGIAARYARSSPCTLVWHIPSSGNVEPFRLQSDRSLRTLPFDYIDKKVSEYGVRRAHYIVGQAHYQEDLLRRNYGRTCDLIVGNWHPEPTQPGAKGPPVQVVWIANLKPRKQPDIFVDLAERLRTVEGVAFTMIGRPASGRYQRRLESRIRKTKGLTYLGGKPIEEINGILAGSHVLVNTSTHEGEGFPNTFVQAWLREVPVVSLEVDPDDILTRHGIGFCSGSFERLVQDTKILIGDPDLRRRMGQRARAYARKHHLLTENLDKVVELLEQDG